MLQHTGGLRGFDPVDTLNSIDTPTLWLFGLRDDAIPILPSIDRLGEFIAAGKTNNQLHVFPYGDHNFTNMVTGEPNDLLGLCRAWVRDQGILTDSHKVLDYSSRRPTNIINKYN